MRHRVLARSGERPDAELVAEAIAGYSQAFAALYHRHGPAAWRVASAVASNRDDASDAVAEAFTRVLTTLAADRLIDPAGFRSYLLTATRTAAIDLHRRADRVQPVDGLDVLPVSSGPAPSGRTGQSHDTAAVASAFRGLPERWRTVLWLTAVEGLPTPEVAAVLAITPTSATHLAVRAQAGLGERFVQAGVREPADPAELGGALRRVVGAAPPALAAAVVARWQLVNAASAPPSVVEKAARTATWPLSMAMAKAQRPLLVTSTGLFALGIIAASVVGSPTESPGAAVRRAPVAALEPRPPQSVEDIVLAGADLPLAAASPPASETGLAAASGAVSVAPDAVATAPTTLGPPLGPAPAPPAGAGPVLDEPLLASAGAVSVAGLPLGAAVELGGPECLGLAVGALVIGCPPPATAPGGTGLKIETNGTVAGGLLANRTISLVF